MVEFVNAYVFPYSLRPMHRIAACFLCTGLPHKSSKEECFAFSIHASYNAVFYMAKKGMLPHPPKNPLKLVCNNLFCFFVEYMNLINIESKFHSIAWPCCCTGIYPCSNRELSQIEV